MSLKILSFSERVGGMPDVALNYMYMYVNIYMDGRSRAVNASFVVAHARLSCSAHFLQSQW